MIQKTDNLEIDDQVTQEKKEGGIRGLAKISKVQVSQYLLFLGIFSLVTVFIWISLQSYGALINQKVDSVKNISLKPINPRLEIEVLEEILKREKYGVDLDSLILTLPIEETATGAAQIIAPEEPGPTASAAALEREGEE